MNICELPTPAILLDLDALEHNIRKYQDICNDHKKQLWPMVKTHKSLEIARMQHEAGATGFLCGTLDECEALCDAGYQNLMYAYPVAGGVSARRVIELSRKCNFTIRLDTAEAAVIMNAEAERAGVTIYCTIIVDCGLHRFGVQPEAVTELAGTIKELKHLCLKGLSTHPGAVYASVEAGEIEKYVEAESQALTIAAEALKKEGITPEIVSTGSTPTFFGSVGSPLIGIYHPGNYIYNDCIQMSIDVADEKECALSVLATVISHPSDGHYVCDAGAKCLGLDQGAHGNGSITGHGRVIGHPELTVSVLSEEVGKLEIKDGAMSNLKVGDQIRIIPNHACSSANLTDFYIAVRGEHVERKIPVDIRGNRCDWNI